MKNILTLSTLIFIFSASIVFAEEYKPLQTLADPSTGLSGLLSSLINIIIALGVLLAVVMLSIGGLQYMMSEAATTKDSAKKTIGQAILGLLILLGSWLILFIINPDIVTKSTDFLSTVDSPTVKSVDVSDGNSGSEIREMFEGTTPVGRGGSGAEWVRRNCDRPATKRAGLNLGSTNISPEGSCKGWWPKDCTYKVKCILKN